MSRHDFINMMEDTVPVSRQMIGEIYELIDMFPYFQSAHLLLLKSLYVNSDLKFDSQLRNSSIHIVDRSVLYWLLNNRAVVESQKPEPARPEVEIESLPDIGDNTDSQQTVIESAKNSEDLIDEIEKDSGEHISGHPIMIATESDNSEPAGVFYFADDAEQDPDEKVIFMDPGFSGGDNPDLLELDNEDGEILLLDDDMTGENMLSQTQVPHRKSQSELIDKFIIANPRIEPLRDKANEPADDISKPFVEESGGLVTETLAKIYTCQGYYAKAIDIYEKLSLKFPEKSSYFASQIEKVKEYIKK